MVFDVSIQVDGQAYFASGTYKQSDNGIEEFKSTVFDASSHTPFCGVHLKTKDGNKIGDEEYVDDKERRLDPFIVKKLVLEQINKKN